MAKMSKNELTEWDELYQYIKYNILNYPDEKNLPKNLVLRLKGLRNGKFMANNKTKNNGNYTFKLILLTFKANKLNINRALEDKSKFKNETHMINYVMTIIENHINDMFDIVENKKKADERANNIIIQDTKEVYNSYIPKTSKIKNNKLENLW